MKNWHKILKFTLIQAFKGSKFVASTIIVGIVILIAAAVSNFFLTGAFDKEAQIRYLEQVVVINETGYSLDNDTFISKHQKDYPFLKISEVSDVTADEAASDAGLLGENPEHSIVLEIAEDQEECKLTVYTPGISTIDGNESYDFAKEYAKEVKNAKIRSTGVSEDKVNMAISDISISQVEAEEAEDIEDDSFLGSMTQLGVTLLIYFLVIFYGQSIGQIVSLFHTYNLTYTLSVKDYKEIY